MGVKGFEDESPVPETYFGPLERKPWWDPSEAVSAVFLDHDLTSEEGLDAAGINWRVSKRPVFYPDITNDQPSEPAPTWGPAIHRADREYVTVRDTDNKFLGGVVKPGFTIFQNAELAVLGDELLGRGAYLHTGGALYGGALVWLLYKFDKAIHVKGDGSPLADYMALINGHDGRHGCTAVTTITRILCGNTCAQAMANAVDRVTIRHTTGIAKRAAAEIRRVMDLHVGYRDTLETVLNNLADRPMTIEEVRNFTTVLIPTPAPDPTDRVIRQTQARRDLIADLFVNSPTLDGVPQTAYRAYQAVVEAADQYVPYRTTKIGTGLDRRATAILDGKAYDQKGDAIRLLLKA